MNPSQTTLESLDVDAGVALARALSAQPSVVAALRQLTATVVTYIGAADAAGITTLGTHEFETTAATSDLPAAIDALQYEFGGPCIDGLLDHAGHVRVDDLSTDGRWPQFAAAALEKTPVRSMLSCRLAVDAQSPLGSLNLYATTAHAFDPAVARAVQLLADQSALAIALVAERVTAANLTRALETSRTIGSAIGVLMTRRLMTSDQAFDLLRISSQHTHRKLRDIAAEVIETGSLAIDPTDGTGTARHDRASHPQHDARPVTTAMSR